LARNFRLTAFINGSNVTIPQKLADRQAAVPTSTFFTTDTNLIASAYAQPPAQEKIKQFSHPKETAAQQFYRGFFGSLPKNVWFVIAGSHLKKEDAERQAQQIQVKGFPADVYEPYGDNLYYAVVIGAHMTQSDAQKLRVKAINTGLPMDTYLWTFPTGHSGFTLPKKECYRKWVDQGIIKQKCEIRYFFCPIGWTTPCTPGMEPSN
jgi:hypothetical protein